MKIKETLRQSRRDFTATLVCENCGTEEHLDSGYDDAYYHNNIIPSFKCKNCGEKAPDNYRGLSIKYPEGELV